MQKRHSAMYGVNFFHNGDNSSEWIRHLLGDRRTGGQNDFVLYDSNSDNSGLPRLLPLGSEPITSNLKILLLCFMLNWTRNVNFSGKCKLCKLYSSPAVYILRSQWTESLDKTFLTTTALIRFIWSRDQVQSSLYWEISFFFSSFVFPFLFSSQLLVLHRSWHIRFWKLKSARSFNNFNTNQWRIQDFPRGTNL